ncbi:unnamed protein product, partial [Brenthis ino]
MYTLKGIFPEPKKEQKKNFIRENMKQLKLIQGKSPKEPKLTLKSHPPRLATPVTQVKSSPSNKNEFLRRKEMRQVKQQEESSEDEMISSESSGRLRDIGCQTVETNLAQKLTESTKLTMLYPKEDDETKKASGDSRSQRSPLPRSPHRADDMMEERNRSRLNAILERKDKDPYLPSGYQKGVLPKYLRDRKESAKEVEDTKPDEDHTACPQGHVTLPDNERKETLRMLRNSFAELVSELNKMPVKTDTLRMRNRKMELEKQLAKLEEGIKVFSRPKVYVKIGE